MVLAGRTASMDPVHPAWTQFISYQLAHIMDSEGGGDKAIRRGKHRQDMVENTSLEKTISRITRNKKARKKP